MNKYMEQLEMIDQENKSKEELLKEGLEDLDRLVEQGKRLEHAARLQKLLADIQIVELLECK